ncbi:MAG: SapC family protein [Pseudomonadota bacterium]
MSNSANHVAPEAAASLPLFYQSLTPLFAERHSMLSFDPKRRFDFAAKGNAIPLLADEFQTTQSAYPIVFTTKDPVVPVALMSADQGSNDMVDADGNWREGQYVPAYLRRFPFALVREKEGSDRMVLCADLTSGHFATEGEEKRLFEGDKPSAVAERIIDFCTRYEKAMQRTMAMTKQLQDHDLLHPGSVTLERREQKFRVDGFQIVDEERLRALADEPLAGLARQGLVGLIAAHHFSLARMSSLFEGPA